MKKWMITLVGLLLTLAVTTVVVFALAGNGSDNDDHDVAGEWKLVEASAWSGGFSLRLPQGWQLNELQGIDSYVGEIIWDGGRLTFDFGWYSNSLVDDDDPQYIVTYEEIGGRRAKLVLPRAEGDELITGVYFEDFDGSNLDIPSQNRLQISGVGLTPDQQETALAVFRTIRPLASESQREPEPSGQQTPIRSDEGIDPNECNGVHNITACEGEPEPGFDVGEPYPLLDTKGPKGPTMCEPDQGVAVTSDGQVSCLDFIPYDGGDLASPSSPPIVEPFQ